MISVYAIQLLECRMIVWKHSASNWLRVCSIALNSASWLLLSFL